MSRSKLFSLVDDSNSTLQYRSTVAANVSHLEAIFMHIHVKSSSYLFIVCCNSFVLRRDGGTDSAFETQFVDVERGAVAVHEDHRGGEVEHAGRQNAQARP